MFFGTARQCTLQPTEHGSNNWVYYVDVSSSQTVSDQRFVLRLYNNNQSTDRVKAEHAVLKACATKASLMCLNWYQSLEIIRPLILCLSVGCVPVSSSCYRGSLRRHQIHATMGQATGELMQVLALLYSDIDTAVDTRSYGPAPYYDLWHVHASITRIVLLLLRGMRRAEGREGGVYHAVGCAQSGGDGDRGVECEEREPLPLSFVHGDLVTDNFMVSNGNS